MDNLYDFEEIEEDPEGLKDIETEVKPLTPEEISAKIKHFEKLCPSEMLKEAVFLIMRRILQDKLVSFKLTQDFLKEILPFKRYASLGESPKRILISSGAVSVVSGSNRSNGSICVLEKTEFFEYLYEFLYQYK